jgi:hypothetical protein
MLVSKKKLLQQRCKRRRITNHVDDQNAVDQPDLEVFDLSPQTHPIRFCPLSRRDPTRGVFLPTPKRSPCLLPLCAPLLTPALAPYLYIPIILILSGLIIGARPFAAPGGALVNCPPAGGACGCPIGEGTPGGAEAGDCIEGVGADVAPIPGPPKGGRGAKPFIPGGGGKF